MSTFHVRLGEKSYKVALLGDGVAELDGKQYRYDARLLEAGVLSLLYTAADGTTRSLRCVAESSPEGEAVLIEGRRFAYALFDPRSLRAGAASAGDSGPRPLKAPMPGRIVRVLVEAGATVAAGQGCVVIEAMKMQNELKAPRAGVVNRLTATVGATVAANTVLLVIE